MSTRTAKHRTSTRSGGCWKTRPTTNRSARRPRRYMIDEYSRFPTYNGAQQALHRVVNLLADGRTVLAHCFAGKDRTGFTVALVLEAAGVDRDAIVADFLSSNQAVPQLRDRILEAIRQRSDVEVTPELMAIHRGAAVRRGSRRPRGVPGHRATDHRRQLRLARRLPAQRGHHRGRRDPAAQRSAGLGNTRHIST